VTALPELVLALEGTAFVVRPGNWSLHWEMGQGPGEVCPDW